ncbi:choice-of-anchor D domain-containing protein [Dokdonella sp.]|uniref:choice-of-anchor D domain-containing protein n=1 Tax=Dokdonella sp. TaxID=2291710 RepID=UPI00378508C6
MPARHPSHAAAFAALALVVTSAVHAANTPMHKRFEFARTDVAIAAAGGIGAPTEQGGGAGALELDGVQGDVTLALLYWNGIDIELPAMGLTGGDANYDQPQIQFDGVQVTGDPVAAGGSNDCWPDANSTLPPSAATWRADVTDRVRLRGDGTYTFSGLSAKPGHSANGLSLIVYFDDGNPANDLRVSHYDGLQSNREQMAFATAFDYAGGPVEAILHASDGQNTLADSTLLWTTLPGPTSGSSTTLRYGTLYDGLTLWPGSSVPHMGHQRGARPDTLWDVRHMPLTAMLGPQRHYTTSFAYASAQDCVSLHVVQVVRQADPLPPTLAPAPYDFGDVVAGATSPPRRFTFSNWMPGPVQIGTPSLTGGGVFHIVADTCSAQSVAPGAQCTVDVTFAPTFVGPVIAYEGTLTVPFEDAVVHSPNPAKPYALLRGSVVPTAPFSRLVFDPDRCAFASIPIGTTSAPVRFRVRSNGTLPLTLDTITGSGATYPLLATTCTAGSVLAPGSECAISVAFRPPSIATSTGFVRAGFHAEDTADASSYLPLQGRGVDVAGAEIFTDGFEPAQCY